MNTNALFLPVLAKQPPRCGLFTKGSPTIGVADPILRRDRLPQPLKLLSEFIQGRALPGEFLELALDGLSGAAVGGVGVHRAEGDAFNGHADELSDHRIAC